MRKRAFFIGLPAALLHLALLGGCANSVDDPDDSDTIVRIDSIDPPTVDTVPTTTTSDLVQVTVSAISRSGAGGSQLSDVQLTKATVFYSPSLGTLASQEALLSQLVASGGSATFDVVAVPKSEKGSLTTGTINATLVVEGQDTLRNRVSASGGFLIVVP